MKVTLPHQLGREEVRRRLTEHSHEIADHIPGGMATVETQWPSDDHMQLDVHAMGQQVTGGIDIADDNVVIAFDLPAALSFFKPMIEKAMRKQGERLLEDRT